MKKSILLLIVLVFMITGLSFNVFGAEKVIKWRLQATYPTGTLVTMHAVEWAKAIKKVTDGRLEVEILPPGAMCGVKDVVNYLEQGVFDCALTYGGMYTGLIPEGDLEAGLPLSHQTWDETWDAFYNRGIGDIVKEAYGEHNIEWYPCAAGIYYHFMTNFPVTKLEDLKGKKIRALGIFGKYVQKLGCSVVNIPGGEVYMAMKLGTIDGALFGACTLQDVKLSEVVDYFTLPTAAQISTSLLINKDSLNKLPADIRRLVENVSPYILMDTGFRYVTEDKKALWSSVKDGKVKISYLPEEEMAKMRKLVTPLWDELASKSPRMKKGVDILKKQMEELNRPMY